MQFYSEEDEAELLQKQHIVEELARHVADALQNLILCIEKSMFRSVRTK